MNRPVRRVCCVDIRSVTRHRPRRILNSICRYDIMTPPTASDFRTPQHTATIRLVARIDSISRWRLRHFTALGSRSLRRTESDERYGLGRATRSSVVERHDSAERQLSEAVSKVQERETASGMNRGRQRRLMTSAEPSSSGRQDYTSIRFQQRHSTFAAAALIAALSPLREAREG
jgi:hypothetical protein